MDSSTSHTCAIATGFKNSFIVLSLFLSISSFALAEGGITKRRLGPNINTPYKELLPIVLADGKTLYFTRVDYPDPLFRAFISEKWDKEIKSCNNVSGMSAKDILGDRLKTDPEKSAKFMKLLRRNTPDCAELEKKREKELYNFDRGSHAAQVYVSKRNSDGTWGESTRLPSPINDDTLANIGNAYITSAAPDRSTLLMVGDFLFGKQRVDSCTDFATMIGVGEKRCLAIAMVLREGDGWKRVDRIRTEPFKHITGLSGAALSPLGNAIVFSAQDSSIPKPNRKSQLYLTERQESGLWTTPLLLTALTSAANDSAPFIGPDGKTLFFTSDRDGGSGGYDLYVSKRTSDSWLEWSTPENLGPEINTPDHDTSLSVDATGMYAFMSSGKGRQQDIYEFNLPPNLSPAPTVLVGGRIFVGGGLTLDDSNQDGDLELLAKIKGQPVPIAGDGNLAGEDQSAVTVTVERLSDGAHQGNANVNAASGEYSLSLPAGEQYAVYVNAPGFAGVGQILDLRKASSGQKISKNLNVAELKVGATIRLNNIFFEVDKASLLPESVAELERLTRILRKYPKMEIEIRGHTDSDASDEYNLNLSEKRVKSVTAKLEEFQIAANRLTSKGYGESRPIASNDSEEGKALNRRVEFKILTM